MVRKVPQLLQEAVAYHQNGDIGRAEALYRRVLEASPGNTDALNLLGMLALRKGQAEEACRLIGRAVRGNPRVAMYRLNRGVACAAAGRSKEAIASYREALRLAPGMVQAHINLGGLYREAGDHSAAAGHYRAVLETAPDHTYALVFLGDTCGDLQQYDEAAGAYRRFLALAGEKPVDRETAMVHYRLGTVLAQLKEFEQAASHLKTFLDYDSRHAMAHNNYGNVLWKLGYLDAALAHLKRAVELKPDNSMAHINLGRLFQEINEPFRSLEYLRRGVKLAPGFVGGYIHLGNILQALGELDEAEECFGKALSLDSGCMDAVSGKARILLARGAAESAYQLLKPMVSGDGTEPAIALTWSRLPRRFVPPADAVAVLQSAFEENPASTSQQRTRYFQLTRLYDAMGDYDTAFSNALLGSALKPRLFDPEAYSAEVGEWLTFYSRETAVRRQTSGNCSELPVFIIGMPRSGTSLVEQILASHPEVFGAGELYGINQLAYGLPVRSGREMHYPFNLSEITTRELGRLAARYLDDLRSRVVRAGGPPPARITDKMPYNYQHLPLIRQLFPAARIIHCRRNPLDTILSIFFQEFSGHHAYTYALSAIGRFYLEYHRLMRFFEETLKIPFMTVDYELLVEDQEAVSRLLIKYTGLEWDDRCLRFYQAERPVITASSEQVRQPIYTSSLNRWKNYAHHLTELKEILSPIL